MRLGRILIEGADGVTARIVVGDAATDEWFDLRKALALEALANGASAQGAQRIAVAIAPESMSDALAGGQSFTDAASRILRSRPATALVANPRFTNGLDPSNYRDFMVFEEHFSFGYRWQNRPVPDVMYELPISYAGNPLSFIGTGQDIPWPSYTRRLDYELELGIVIGKQGTNLTPENALDHVLGLTILNDVSARDIQAIEMTGGLGPSKGKHFACVTGPWITTLDEIPESGLRMTATVNGKLLCDTTSSQMVWSVAEIVAWASQGELLVPGTLLGSGTCNGGSTVELGITLSPGDTLDLEIEGLGATHNVLSQPAGDPWTPRARSRDANGDSSEFHFLR